MAGLDGDVGIGTALDLAGQPQDRQAGAQLVGDRRVLGRQPLRVDGLARLDRRQVSLEHPRQLRLLATPRRRRRSSRRRESVEFMPESSSIWFSRSTRRAQSIRTAPAERPILRGDLLERDVLQGTQDEHLAVVGGQPIHGVGQQHRLLAPDGRLAGRCRMRGQRAVDAPRPSARGAAPATPAAGGRAPGGGGA